MREPFFILPLADIGDSLFGIVAVVVGLIITWVSSQKKKHKLPQRQRSLSGSPTTDIDERIRERRMQREAKRKQIEEAKRQRRELRRRRAMGQPADVEVRREPAPSQPRPAPPVERPPQRVERPRRQEPPRPRAVPSPTPRRAASPTVASDLAHDAIGAKQKRRRRSNSKAPADKLRALLQNKSSARSIVIAAEVLGSPVALRDTRV